MKEEIGAMAYSHSFSPEFYGDIYEPDGLTSRPTTVAQAIVSMKELERNQWDRTAKEVFGVPGEHLLEDEVFEKIIETDTVSNLTSPVEVWIDEDGYYTLLVWDEQD